MCKFKLMCLISFGMLCFIEGQKFEVTTEFKDGNLTFYWPKTRHDYTSIKIKLGHFIESEWNNTFGQSYRVDNVLTYGSVKIKVRDDRPSMGYPNTFKDYDVAYTVSRVDAKIGDSKIISWNASSFPQTGLYFIYHMYNETEVIIITINGEIPDSQPKYIYHSRPYNSTNITFEVKDIKTSDSGFYTGGPTKFGAGSEGGVVLVVNNKPTKPIIKGNIHVPVDTQATLTCSSYSTSAPDYYSRIATLSYKWYINDAIQIHERNRAYEFLVTKAIKYNRYSCQSQEKFKGIQRNISDRSEYVQINPMYGPESVMITPKPGNDTITIKDGKPLGPYNCSAHCNPPCTLQWKYKHPSGDFVNDTSYDISSLPLPMLNADRTRMTLIRCVAINRVGSANKDIKLKILYFEDPRVYINEKLQYSSTINEGTPLNVTCLLGGNPTPEVILRKLTANKIIGEGHFNYTWIKDAKCSDTSNYSCEGKSSEFESRIQSFHINVTCDPRLDNSNLFKSIYGSKSGPDVNVHVSLPVIANPLTSSSGFTWSGPTRQSISTDISQRDNVIYKKWINSTIPIPNQSSFGNYSLKYKGNVFADITINAEDKPQPPLNFTGYSYASGYINLTWISNFNGGPEQFFILSMKEGPNWRVVKNLTDPGKDNIGYYDLGSLSPGNEYLYRLESCNRINCSFSPREVKVKVKALPASSSLFGDTTMLIVIGASVAVFVLVVILTVAITMYCKRKKSALKKSNSDERLSGSTEQDNTQPDVVVYAAVDKSVLLKNRQQDDVAESDVIKDKNDDNETMYSEVIKKPNIHKQTDSTKEKKKNGEKELRGKKEEAKASNRNDDSRTENQDGLVYIDVEFAKNPQSSDSKGKPIIHGEEERTEYTFVDFSIKAPPKQEQPDNTT